MAYLTIAEYLLRYGAAETIRATDETKAGEVDEAKVAQAIEGASAETDSYLAVRYTLPISEPTPEIVADIVGDLARERIMRARPTDLIVANAARARSQLRDLSAGRASIPANPAGGGAVETATGDATRSLDARRRVFTESALCDFVNLGYSGRNTLFDY